MSDYVKEIKFPKQYKPLPPGYVVSYSGSHYFWANEKDEGLICWDKYWCRRCAFAHYEQTNKKGKTP